MEAPLNTFEEMQEKHLAHRDRLQRELAYNP